LTPLGEENVPFGLRRQSTGTAVPQRRRRFGWQPNPISILAPACLSSRTIAASRVGPLSLRDHRPSLAAALQRQWPTVRPLTLWVSRQKLTSTHKLSLSLLDLRRRIRPLYLGPFFQECLDSNVYLVSGLAKLGHSRIFWLVHTGGILDGPMKPLRRAGKNRA